MSTETENTEIKNVTPTTTEEPDDIKPVTTTTTTESKKEVEKTPTEASDLALVKNAVAIVKANPLYTETSKILHWRDPVKTGLLFGIFNFFYFLSTWAEYSFLTIVSYLLLTLLSICFGYSNYVVLRASWLQGKTVENPFKERFRDAKFRVSRETAQAHFNTILDLVNLTIDTFRDVFYCTDNFLSLRFFFYFYLGATIGNWFSGATLVYLVTLGYFVWPRLYEEKQKEIDHFYGIAAAQAKVYYGLALTKIPPGVLAKFPQLKPKQN